MSTEATDALTWTCLAFSPDGQNIGSGTARSGATITDLLLKNKHQLGMLADAHTHVTAVAWSPDGEKYKRITRPHDTLLECYFNAPCRTL
jgi:WD40 repeat protein